MEKVNATRKEMVDFLKNHFRYDTANNWNRSTSYARNVKIYNIGLSEVLEDKALDLICEEGFNELVARQYDPLIEQFEEETSEDYTIGFNGRSDGYLVLYNKLNPLKSIDMGEDFEDFDDFEVGERYSLVKLFDKYCDYLVDAFKDVVENVTIREEEVITKVKVFDLN